MLLDVLGKGFLMCGRKGEDDVSEDMGGLIWISSLYFWGGLD